MKYLKFIFDLLLFSPELIIIVKNPQCNYRIQRIANTISMGPWLNSYESKKQLQMDFLQYKW